MRIALFTSDLQASRRFYAALGFRTLSRTADGVFVALDKNVLELRTDARAVAGPHYFTPEIERFPRGTGVEITLETDDVGAIHELALSHDADIVRSLERSVSDGPNLLLADPDGYLLRFVTPSAARHPAMARGTASR